MEVNGVTNLAFTIPETPGVPATAGGSASGTDESLDDGASDVASDDGAEVVDPFDDYYPEQEPDLLYEFTPYAEEDLSAEGMIQKPETSDKTAGETLFIFLIPVLLLVFVVVFIVLRCKRS
jgi:hypothetical protein